MDNKKLTFDEWCDLLDQVSVECGFKKPITASTGRDCWHGYYNEGETPESAFKEDMSYA